MNETLITKEMIEGVMCCSPASCSSSRLFTSLDAGVIRSTGCLGVLDSSSEDDAESSRNAPTSTESVGCSMNFVLGEFLNRSPREAPSKPPRSPPKFCFFRKRRAAHLRSVYIPMCAHDSRYKSFYAIFSCIPSQFLRVPALCTRGTHPQPETACVKVHHCLTPLNAQRIPSRLRADRCKQIEAL